MGGGVGGDKKQVKTLWKPTQFTAENFRVSLPSIVYDDENGKNLEGEWGSDELLI